MPMTVILQYYSIIKWLAPCPVSSILVILLATRYHKNALRASLMILSKEWTSCLQYSNSLLVKLNTSYLKFFVCLYTKVYSGIFRPNMLKCFIPRGVNVSDAYRVFHIELIICFTSFVTIYRSTHNYIHVFKTFFVNNVKSFNTCVELCALLCLCGSRSEASNSLNFITNLYSMDKYNIVDLFFTITIIDVNSPISADMMSAGAINDVLCMRD